MESLIVVKKKKKNFSYINREDSTFLRNQRFGKDTENYFDKTQNLCFLGILY